MPEAGSHVPVYIPDIITELVFPYFAESHTPAPESTVVLTCKDLTGKPARSYLNLPDLL
jgi:hypothetical protein